MITQDEELDKLLPPGPCVDCGEVFEGYLLDDAGLCMACDIIADDAAYKAERDAEDAALCKAGWAVWDKACAEAQVLKLAEDDLWVEEQWEKNKAGWEKQEAELLPKPMAEANPWVEVTGEPLEAFVGRMAEADAAPPDALLRRSDGEVLFYDSEVNWVFGEPGSGKSWLALYVVQESLLRGQRTVFWDFEMSPGQTKARCLALGLDLVEAENSGLFLYLKPFAEESRLAMSQLKEWQQGGDGPALVVIDAAASSGAPSDGASIEEWLGTFINPFAAEGHTVLIIDHVAKQVIGRPDGPIGSARKLQAVTGAALYLSGIAWTQTKDGVLKLVNHKDRYGALPAARRQPVARIYGRHINGTLTLSIEPPEAEDNPVQVFGPMLKSLADHPDGVVGHSAMRELVSGRVQKKDSVIAEAITEGYILKDKPGKKVRYRISETGQEFFSEDDV